MCDAVVREREKEREELLISRAQLEDRVASLSSEMAEKEEYRTLQVKGGNDLERQLLLLENYV